MDKHSKNINPLMYKIIQNSWVQHLLFWVVSFYVLITFFAQGDWFILSNFLYTTLFHLSLIPAVYTNRFLIHTLLPKKWYVGYVFSVLLLIYLGIRFNELIFSDLSDVIFPGFYYISYYTFQELAYFFIVYIGLTTLLKFSKAWFTLAETRQKLAQLEEAKLQAELDGLKSQINPHFLFNALNSIYYLAIDNQEKTPVAILKLADVLRYMLYDSNSDKVALQKEIKHLKDYLMVQQMRLDEDIPINFGIMGNTKGIFIAPLLFIPFVENAFKHGLKGDIEGQYLDILLELNEDTLIFKVKNNQGETDQTEPPTGIGLENVKRRLDLIYPNSHQLIIKNQLDFFEIKLIIHL